MTKITPYCLFHPILIASLICGVSTVVYDKQLKKLSRSLVCTIFAAILLVSAIAFAICFPFSIILVIRVRDDQNFYEQTLIIIMLIITITSLVVIFSKINVLLKMHPNLNHILVTLQEIEKHLNIKYSFFRRLYMKTFFIVIVFVIIGSFYTYDSYTIPIHGSLYLILCVITYINHIGFLVVEMQFTVLCYFAYSYLDLIETEFRRIDRFFYKYRQSTNFINITKLRTNLSHLGDAHKLLLKVIGLINETYDIFLFTSLIGMATVAMFSGYILVFGGFSSSYDGKHQIFLSVYFSLNFFIICWTAQMIKSKGENCNHQIAYLLCYDNVEDEIAEEIVFMLENAVHRPIHFTALGFFNVDFALLTSAVSMVVTYFIILIQNAEGALT